MEQKALKILAVVFSAFLFSGCQTIEPNTGWDGGYKVGQVLGDKKSETKSASRLSSDALGPLFVGLEGIIESSSDSEICAKAISGKSWDTRFNYWPYVAEAARRGIGCGLSVQPPITLNQHLAQMSESALCFDVYGAYDHEPLRTADGAIATKYIEASRRRGLSKKLCRNMRYSWQTKFEAGSISEADLCRWAFDYRGLLEGNEYGRTKYAKYVQEKNLCGGIRPKIVEIDSGERPSDSIDGQEAGNNTEQVKQLERRLAMLEAEKKATQQSISQDAEAPSIRITSTDSDGARGTISGTATDNTGIAEVLVDGQAVAVDSSGRFSTSTFIPSGGIDIQITAYDLKGLSTTETVRLERSKGTQTVSRLAAANPLVGPKQETSRDRAALIIGLEKYAVAQPAQFASRDAQMFADYAREKLGIPAGNVKVLTDSGASEREILTALKVWLPTAVKPGTTDLYVFYAGHGMPTADGSSAYLVPYDGDVRLLEDTAISRKRFFDEIGAAKPRSATFFFDNCYSGATRSEELLLASRPLGIKVQETDVPDNYLVFTAGESNQTAGVLDEVKHGRFSYFVFKGLEGEADANQDGKISAGELHTYVRESVGRFSAGAQTPTMLGDAGRWVLR